ncbi:threonine--tRNA ligase [Iamia majanohamensis]|uniref:Threonine--tRNA ligase n=1 Tax=Iamia majanohamensis TaxID=467976 RepID=A0AAE9Y981_9ACTN|nr:threonine--tRNA ligase [Iamia majanohamensis]WCO68952.1 threonine--tRNA ligase [Iamia majanohamensis]
MADITISLPDGSSRQVDEGTTVGQLAASIGRGLAKAAVIGVVNGVERDLVAPLADGDTVEIVTADSPRGLFTIRHSTAHVMAQAVLDEFPGATFGIGPPVEDGFYYDFQLPAGADGKPATFEPDDLPRIEARMREIIAESQPFVRDDIPNDAAREVFADHPFKLEIIDGEAEDPTSVTETGTARTYENPPASPKERPPFRGHAGFIDLCRGPHVPDTKAHLGHFKLLRIAGAYWRGDETKPQLQRVYGTAWASKKDLDAHLERLEEAAKRDHRKLGAELDLFSFPEEVGSGLAVFHPKGGTVRRLMEDYSRRRHEAADYEFVYSPHITKAQLFETSGHLQWFADGMFPPMHFEDEGGAEGQDYYLKPMNCPFHCLIFQSRQRSYRELPLRLFEFGSVYRYEKSGVVHGLTRVRGMTQDDAHIYCTREQMGAELQSLLGFVLGLLRDYGLDDFYLELSTRGDSDKFIGADEDWEEATAALAAAAGESGLELVDDPGGAAFYGPKISVQARDAIGRTWQMSTIQLDFQEPPRFGLEYVGADGARHTPVMIHRALFGSVERFFGVLVEHYAGAFPTWLAPVQVRLLPVRDDHMAYADRIADRLRAEGFRADVVDAGEKLGNRIRKAKGEKLPYVLVVGDDDVDHGTVGVNPRGGEVERDVSADDFVDRLRAEVLAQTGGR